MLRHQSHPVAAAPCVSKTTADDPVAAISDDAPGTGVLRAMSHTYTLPFAEAAAAWVTEGLRQAREKLVAVRKLRWLKLVTTWYMRASTSWGGKCRRGGGQGCIVEKVASSVYRTGKKYATHIPSSVVPKLWVHKGSTP